MIDFVRAAFRRYFSALLVIIVVIFTVVGTIFGMSARSGSGGVLGFLIGAALGVFTIIVSGGLVATFLHIDETLTRMYGTIKEMDENLKEVDENLRLLSAPAREQRKPAAPQRKKASGEFASPRAEAPSGYFTDARDGRKYRTVEIGGKTWMAENLSHQPETGNFWVYGGEKDNKGKYGVLYDWDAAMFACPAGWHLPTREEWGDLIAAAGGEAAGGALKSAVGWSRCGGGSDDYGFSALPGGYRDFDGAFEGLGVRAIWWTSTEELGSEDAAYSMAMKSDDECIIGSISNKDSAYSVRCVADD